MSGVNALNDRKQKRSTKVLTAVMGIIFVALGIYMPSIYSIVCGVIILFASLLRKNTIVNKEGIIVTYDARVYKYCESWRFSEIKEMHMEKSPNSEYLALHFTKDVISKRLIFKKKDANAIVELALSQNPNIHFDEINT